jgi:uncharacterized protein YjbI with pentapeptide repeats
MKNLLDHWTSLDSRTQTRLVLIGVLVVAVILGFVSAYEEGHFDWRSIGGNLSTEMIGGVITYIIIDRVIGSRREQDAKREAQEEHKRELIEKLGSRINAESIRAAEELRSHGWIEDGSLAEAMLANADLQMADFEDADLRGVNLKNANLLGATLKNASLRDAKLFGANLRGATLYRANLENANLMKADLRKCNLIEANLENAGLKRARLEGADLWRANLQKAYLVEANLEDANLARANLSGANLTDANLRNTNLKGAVFDETTTLPDGETWTRQTNLSRFTDPNHPQFWRSEDAGSPAYHGYEPANQHEEM